VLRALLTLLFAAVWTLILWLPAVVLALLTPSGEGGMWVARRIWSTAVLFVAGVRLTVRHNPAVDPKRPYVFVSNHQGLFDVPATVLAVDQPVRFVAKRSLGWIPFFGWFIVIGGHILIDRTNRARAFRSLERAGARIRGGKSVLLFAEGTRSRDALGRVQPFKKGPFVLALTAGVPVVPVAVNGSHEVLPKGRWHLEPGPIQVAIGDPIPTEGLDKNDRDHLLDIVRARVIEHDRSIGGAGGVD